MLRSKLFQAFAATAVFAVVGVSQAHAVSLSYNFTGANAPNSGSDGNVRSFTNNGVTVAVTAWSSSSTSSNFNDEYLTHESNGLGVLSSNNDGSVDDDDRTELVLFKFGEAVDPNTITLSVEDDSDIEAYILNATSLNFASLSFSNLLSTFTSLGVFTNGNSYSFNTALTGNYLLISTYRGDNSDNEDFRIKGLTASTAPAPVHTPEPASMLLLGSGLAGLIARRRRA